LCCVVLKCDHVVLMFVNGIMLKCSSNM